MTVLHSCCCWRSVRKGSIACGIYTGLYCALNAIHSSYLLREELRFLAYNSTSRFIDHNLTDKTSVVFSSLIFMFSTSGIITTVLLLYGIYKDLKYLLIPWIVNMALFTAVDVLYVFYGLFVHALQWNPSVAILITIDFFLNALNLYAILCVVSQYQEYNAGRGRADDAPALSTSNQRDPIQPISSNGSKKQPNQLLKGVHQVPEKKSVKFEEEKIERVSMSTIWEESSRNSYKGIDRAPLINAAETIT